MSVLRCLFPVFLPFWVARGWSRRSLSEFGAGFSAQAGTFDFERQYSVLGVFSRFQAVEKRRKSNKKVLENLLFFQAAKKAVRGRFSSFLGSLLDSIFEPGAEKMDLEMVLFSRTCLGSSPGEAQAHFGVVLGSLWEVFLRCL